MPCATCCSQPSKRTEKTTNPPPGLTPRSPDVKPPMRPTLVPAMKSWASKSRSPRPARLRLPIELPEPSQHAVDYGDARLDIDLLSPRDLQDQPLEEGDEGSGDRFGAQIAR